MKYPLEGLIQKYAQNGVQSDIAYMEAYLKNRFKFLGLKSPLRNQLTKQYYKEHGKPSKEDFEEIIRTLYALNEREYHYLAIDISRMFKKKWEISDIETIEYLMRNHGWWDTIDFIASHLMGSYLLTFPKDKERLSKKYISDEDMWVRRTGILFQLKYKKQMDVGLLSNIILQCSHEKEFFIEKAIGWILREYSKTNPEWVSTFIANHELRPLSIREGSKYLN